MAPQGKPSDATRIQWNSTMDELLIGVLKDEHMTGGRHPDVTWKHDDLAHAAKEVFDQTGGEEYPKYKLIRSQKVPFYDDLDCIFGEEKVTGFRNFEGSESSAHVEPPLDKFFTHEDEAYMVNLRNQIANQLVADEYVGSYAN